MEVPKEIRIVGPGFESMDPERFATMAQILGGMLASHDLKLEYNPPIAEIDRQSIVTEEQLIDFAENQGLSPSSGRRLFTSLGSAYLSKLRKRQDSLRAFGKVIIPEHECPIEFYDRGGQEYRRRFPRYLKADSLLPTANWAQEYHLTGMGDKTMEVLVGFVNDRLNPEEPLEFKPKQTKGDYEAVPIPATEDFEEDNNSKFLDSIKVDETDLKIVTASSIERFAVQELGIKEGKKPIIRAMINSMGDALYGDRLPWRITIDSPQFYEGAEGLVAIKAGAMRHAREEDVWGVTPKPFVEMTHLGLYGDFAIANLKGSLTSHIVTNYINAISK